LELGGYAPVYVGATAELKHAARACLESAWNFAGQSCISAQNIFVHPSVHTAFIAELRDLAQSYAWGDPDDESTRCSCLIDRASQERLKGVSADHKILVQAPQPMGRFSAQNPHFHPLIVEGISQREVFGPLAFVSQCEFSDFIKTANSFEHRLQAAVFTGNLEEHRVALETLRFGGIVINEAPSTRWDPAPYGGFGKSGTGREGPAFAISEMTDLQSWIERI